GERTPRRGGRAPWWRPPCRLPGRRRARPPCRGTTRAPPRPSSPRRSRRRGVAPPAAVNAILPFRFGPTSVPFEGPVTFSEGVETTRAAITPPAAKHATTATTASTQRGLTENWIGGSTGGRAAGGAPSR